MPPKCLKLLFVLLQMVIASSLESNSTGSEYEVLLELKQQWNRAPSISAWDPAIHPCKWPGIQCTRNSVTGIMLNDQKISERIPALVCNLKNLTTLDLSNNFIPGGFPVDLYNCSKLQRLNLSSNHFVGPLPSDIYKLSSLQHLDIRGNKFTSEIPNAIGQLPNLTALDLSDNMFQGDLPPAIGNLVNLQKLDMSHNYYLESEIPKSFGQLKKLKYLRMWNNLRGEIPDNFANLSSLEHLDLRSNNLEGRIPSGLFLLRNLTRLYLSGNSLSGEISKSVEALNLVEIYLSFNMLEGTVPEDFGKLQKLEILHMESNQLSGSLPATLGKLPALKELIMFSNNLAGALPPELGLHSELETFDVSSNQFSGELPKNLCARGVLTSITASANNFHGEIPNSFAKCDTLETLSLSVNRLSGQVPFGLWGLPNITTLDLSGNEISGLLPTYCLDKLQVLDISRNNFSDPIPSSASCWRSLVRLVLRDNQFQGAIPLELTALSKLQTLALDGNNFSGELPSQIISWNSLGDLTVARNKLSGPVPTAIVYLPNLFLANLSFNEFSGQIPLEFGKLRAGKFDLSSNNLRGKIPQALDNEGYWPRLANNPNLCSEKRTSELPRCSSWHRSRYLPMILLPALTLLLVILYLIFSKVPVKQRVKQSEWTMTPFHSLSFTEANILSSLTEDNVIGSGGSGKIYCIQIEDSHNKVAVKRIWNYTKASEILGKQFAAEVEILGTFRHSNVVKLLCCISSESTKLLVYEYMENQSLDKWLHGERRTYESPSSDSVPPNNSGDSTTLDWPTRLRIAIGAAKGLCYLHHSCSPPIIHRDVKSSNILLDSEFNAKIADFGLSKIVENNTGEPHTASAVAGSFGYIAPEYWRTRRLNEKIDIFSFGVVLLELTTGKEPCRGNDHLNLADWSWQHYCENRPLEDALDNTIKEQCCLQEMLDMFKLGLMCTNKNPSSRPTMKKVLQLLLLRSHQHGSDARGHDQNEEENSTIPLFDGVYISA